MSELICLVTPGHISSNPRLVKEARALLNAGYRVHIVFTQYMETLIPFDHQILESLQPAKYSVLNWSVSGDKTKRNTSALVQKAYGYLSKLGMAGNTAVYHAANRQFSWQLNAAVAVKAGYYIAHNLGALPVAALAAERLGVKYGFDAEDFHRQEITNDTQSPSYKNAVTIEDRFIPGTSHLTAASFDIAAHYAALYPDTEPVPVLNTFTGQYLVKEIIPRGADEPLRLFWFSQTVGPNRGLEQLMAVLHKMNDIPLEITLLGMVSESFRSKLISLAPNVRINFPGTKSEPELLEITAQHHVGLALEQTFPLNRDICLTNKIFTYLLGGLAILASDTRGQSGFLNRYPAVGKVFTSEVDMETILRHWYHNQDELHSDRVAARKLASEEMNWEKEQHKLLSALG